MHEARCTGIIHERLQEKNVLPVIHLADAAYINAEHLSDEKKRGLRFIGSTRKNPSWQTRAGRPELAEASLRGAETAVCPAGKTMASWREYENEQV